LTKSEAYFQDAHKMTNFAEAIASAIEASEAILLSDYDMFLMACDVYRAKTVKYLRGDYPSVEQYKRARSVMKEARIIDADKNYSRLWRVVSRGREAADEVVCSADPYCYISHLSAMQRYGITLRRPEALHITRPTNEVVKGLLEKRKEEDRPRLTFSQEAVDAPTLTQVRHPRKIRGRNLSVKKTKFSGQFRPVRGSGVRVASIGQVFLDMLEDPKLCGGMSHVLEVWDEHAQTYLKEISQRVDEAGTGIAKVRAGYILSERMGIQNGSIGAWELHAQRGGSRKLDPDADYNPHFSERWMISINAG
jgi:predicted transcriptional regulator of viral defense system